MFKVREAKRAALCHSTGRTPRTEVTGPGIDPACGDGGAQGAHQPNIEVQVMDGVEARSEDLLAAVEMPQVGAAEVPAGVAVAGGIHRAQVAGEGAVADVDDARGGEQVTVAGVP